MGTVKTAALPPDLRNWDQRETVRLPSYIDSRMERLLQPTNWMDRLYAVDRRATNTLRHQVSWQRRRLGYHGVLKKDPQYQGRIDFSADDGYTFSDPAINVEGNRIIQIRLTLSQHETDVPILGWALDWYKPAAWEWADNLGRRTYEENTSNPFVVTRVLHSPNNPVPVGFRVIIAERYY